MFPNFGFWTTHSRSGYFQPGPGDSAQFICTTFRPELVTAADQCYGVYHRHKVSNINMIDADQAMQFITHETTAATTSAMPAQ